MIKCQRRAKAIKAAKDKLLTQYIIDTQTYYRAQILKGNSLKDIIRESLAAKEIIILRNLVFNEFPQYKQLLCKYLIIQ